VVPGSIRGRYQKKKMENRHCSQCLILTYVGDLFWGDHILVAVTWEKRQQTVGEEKELGLLPLSMILSVRRPKMCCHGAAMTWLCSQMFMCWKLSFQSGSIKTVDTLRCEGSWKVVRSLGCNLFEESNTNMMSFSCDKKASCYKKRNHGPWVPSCYITMWSFCLSSQHEILTSGQTNVTSWFWTFSLPNCELTKVLFFLKYPQQIFCHGNRKWTNSESSNLTKQTIKECSTLISLLEGKNWKKDLFTIYLESIM
jgi:hypothetical protein